MKLNSDGVTISILILITMILICHTMNYLYPKNKFANIPQATNYNEIYYSNKNSKLCSNINTGLSNADSLSNQAEIPYDIITSCSNEGSGIGTSITTGTSITGGTAITSGTAITGGTAISGGTAITAGNVISGGGSDSINIYLNSLSESELAVLYKVVYEDTAREIITRSLRDISAKKN